MKVERIPGAGPGVIGWRIAESQGAPTSALNDAEGNGTDLGSCDCAACMELLGEGVADVPYSGDACDVCQFYDCVCESEPTLPAGITDGNNPPTILYAAAWRGASAEVPDNDVRRTMWRMWPSMRWEHDPGDEDAAP